MFLLERLPTGNGARRARAFFLADQKQCRGVESNILDVLAKYFEKAGFGTHLVTTVATCLDAVLASPPAVVVMLTNNILEKPAFEVAEAIRISHPRCGFVSLAGSDINRRERFLAEGYKFRIRFIPIPLPELLAAVSEALDKPS
jgi:hypothetical protein